MCPSTEKKEMRKVIYTCITGGYDTLRQPDVVDPSYDYICYSDDFKDEKVGVWTIRRIPFSNDDATRRSRYVKILPHKVLGEYDISVWMDASFVITDRSFYDALERKINSGCLEAHLPHPLRDCVYEEIVRCYLDTRISFMDAVRQWRHLSGSGFPRHFGLLENGLMLRRHNDPRVIRISEEWWKDYIAFSSRDQLVLMPVFWKEGFMPDLLLGEGVNSTNAPCVRLDKHPGQLKARNITGFRRLPLKARWTWRKFVAGLVFEKIK